MPDIYEARRIYEALTKYMDPIALAEFVASGVSFDDMRSKLAELKGKASEKDASPLKRWVTDKLVFENGIARKEFKEMR